MRIHVSDMEYLENQSTHWEKIDSRLLRSHPTGDDDAVQGMFQMLPLRLSYQWLLLGL